MKNFKIYNSVRRLGAAVLIPFSLMATLTMTGCQQRVEEEATSENVIILPEFENEDIIIVDYEEANAMEEQLETFSDFVEALKEKAADYIDLEIQRDAINCPVNNKIPSPPSAGVGGHRLTSDYQITMTLEGKKCESLEDEAFYDLLNQLFRKYQTDEIHIVLNNYSNQIDFSKIKLPEGIYIEVHHSKNVSLNGLTTKTEDLKINCSTLDSYEIIREIGQKKGSVAIEQGDMNEIKKILRSDGLFFDTFAVTLDGKDFYSISEVNAINIWVQISGNSTHNILYINENTQSLHLSKGENVSTEEVLNTNIAIGALTKVYFDGIELIDFKTPLFRTISRAPYISIANPVEGVKGIWLPKEKEPQLLVDQNTDAKFIYDDNQNIVGIQVSKLSIEDTVKIATSSPLNLEVSYLQNGNNTKRIIFCNQEPNLESGTYTEAQFYDAINRLIAFKKDENKSLILDFVNYKNQIDFSKLNIPENFENVAIKLSGSENVDLKGISERVTEITLANSTLKNFSSVMKELIKKDGCITFSTASDLESLSNFVTINPRTQLPKVGLGNIGSAISLLPNLNAKEVIVDCQELPQEIEELVFHKNVGTISLYYAPSELKVDTGNKTSVNIYYSDIDLNGTLIRSLQNCPTINVIAPLIEGVPSPKDIDQGSDEIFRIVITKTDCFVETFGNTNLWNITYEYNSDGTKEFRLIHKDKNTYESLETSGGITCNGSGNHPDSQTDFSENTDGEYQYQLCPR